MKAKRVKGLDPDGTLADNARRIGLVRLAELYSFLPRALDPRRVEALHDMRIAAKRLRYVLEICEPALGPVARRGAAEARKLQELLGEIHDCDELLPRARRHAALLAAEDGAAVRADAAGGKDLDPALVREAPNRDAYRGLAGLTTYLTARRALLFDRFRDRLGGLDAECFRERMQKGLARVPEPRAEPAPAGAVRQRDVRAPALVSGGVE